MAHRRRRRGRDRSACRRSPASTRADQRLSTQPAAGILNAARRTGRGDRAAPRPPFDELSPIEASILLLGGRTAPARGNAVPRRHQRSHRTGQVLRRHRRPQVRERRARQARRKAAPGRGRGAPARSLIAQISACLRIQLIARHRPRHPQTAVLGPGDDCALVAPSPGMELAITTDMLVEGTHFLPDTDPATFGWKTLAVNLSDLAAMGAAQNGCCSPARYRTATRVGLPASPRLLQARERLRRRRHRWRHHTRPAQPVRHGHRRTAGGGGSCVAMAQRPTTTSGSPAALGLAALVSPPAGPHDTAGSTGEAAASWRCNARCRASSWSQTARVWRRRPSMSPTACVCRSRPHPRAFRPRRPAQRRPHLLLPPGKSEPRPGCARSATGRRRRLRTVLYHPIAARQQVVMLAAELDLLLWRIGYTVAASDERPAGDILLTDADGKPLPSPERVRSLWLRSRNPSRRRPASSSATRRT